MDTPNYSASDNNISQCYSGIVRHLIHDVLFIRQCFFQIISVLPNPSFMTSCHQAIYSTAKIIKKQIQKCHFSCKSGIFINKIATLNCNLLCTNELYGCIENYYTETKRGCVKSPKKDVF